MLRPRKFSVKTPTHRYRNHSVRTAGSIPFCRFRIFFPMAVPHAFFMRITLAVRVQSIPSLPRVTPNIYRCEGTLGLQHFAAANQKDKRGMTWSGHIQAEAFWERTQ